MDNQEKEITIIGTKEPLRQTTTEFVEPTTVDLHVKAPAQSVTEGPKLPDFLRRAPERQDAADDFLLSQIDEFRVKAQQLQELLRAKEDKAKELQQIVNERSNKADELQQIVNERQEKADGITAEVSRRITGMTDRVDARLDRIDEHLESANRVIGDQVESNLVSFQQTMDIRLDEISRSTSAIDAVTESLTKIQEDIEEAGRRGQETGRNITQMTVQLQEVREAADRLDTVKSDLSDKIHTESVQSYRNTQELLRAMDERLNKIDTIEKGVHSIKNMSAAIVVLAVIDLLGVAAAVALSLGLF